MLIVGSAAAGNSKNGFNLDGASIPIERIQHGGPAKDGIPALYYPEFVTVDQADYLADHDRVLGVEINGQSKAYPIAILDWHEVVNDKIAADHYTVTYCPLCGTGMVFTTNYSIDGTATQLLFGVSGLLYESDVLLYDRQTMSLWSQIAGTAVSGPLKGTKLSQLPVFHTSWKSWRKQHPASLVMSELADVRRDYSASPYSGYQQSRQLYFSVSNKAPKSYHPKERVLGVEVAGVFKAYPFKELTAAKQIKFADTVNGKHLQINWDQDADTAYVTHLGGKPYVSLIAYWFAWYTFHPNTLLFTATQQ